MANLMTPGDANRNWWYHSTLQRPTYSGSENTSAIAQARAAEQAMRPPEQVSYGAASFNRGGGASVGRAIQAEAAPVPSGVTMAPKGAMPGASPLISRSLTPPTVQPQMNGFAPGAISHNAPPPGAPINGATPFTPPTSQPLRATGMNQLPPLQQQRRAAMQRGFGGYAAMNQYQQF